MTPTNPADHADVADFRRNHPTFFHQPIRSSYRGVTYSTWHQCLIEHNKSLSGRALFLVYEEVQLDPTDSDNDRRALVVLGHRDTLCDARALADNPDPHRLTAPISRRCPSTQQNLPLRMPRKRKASNG